MTVTSSRTNTTMSKPSESFGTLDEFVFREKRGRDVGATLQTGSFDDRLTPVPTKNVASPLRKERQGRSQSPYMAYTITDEVRCSHVSSL